MEVIRRKIDRPENSLLDICRRWRTRLQQNPQDEQPHSLKEVATEKKVKEIETAVVDSYELLEENMRRAKNGEHIIDPKTRK